MISRQRVADSLAFVVLLPLTLPLWVGMTVSTLWTATATAAFFDMLDALADASVDEQ